LSLCVEKSFQSKLLAGKGNLPVFSGLLRLLRLFVVKNICWQAMALLKQCGTSWQLVPNQQGQAASLPDSKIGVQ
jgi:hypothetical protein